MSGRRAIEKALEGYAGDYWELTAENLADGILADPGPLLEALAAAGVLREERDPVACHGCGRTPCLARCRVNDDRRVRARYATTWWEVPDARA